MTVYLRSTRTLSSLRSTTKEPRPHCHNCVHKYQSAVWWLDRAYKPLRMNPKCLFLGSSHATLG
ncbi:Uncharacterised protein [Vibrio cholerae]|nr:Uncharacterised protein [Vibrio cholerae]